MVRTPQTPELLTLEEISAIKKQLLEAVQLCEEAEKVAGEKGVPGFFVVYKSAILRTADSLRRAQASIYQTVAATRIGKPMNATSVTPRAARIAKSKAQVTEVRNHLRRNSGKSE